MSPRRIGEAVRAPGGLEAMQLRVAEQYLARFGELANASDTTLIVPSNLADVASMVTAAMNFARKGSGGPAST